MSAVLERPVTDALAKVSPRATNPGPATWVLVATSAAELIRHEDAWARLAGRALVPNSFYEPWMLLPAIEAFGRGLTFRFVLVFRDGHTSLSTTAGERALIGFFPLQQRRRLKGLPIRTLALWQHLHCFLTTPLVDGDHAREALETFFTWTRQGKTPRILELPLVNGDGPFKQLLIDVLNDQGHVSFVDEAYNRALWRHADSGEKYLEETLSTGNRKELRRQRRRLGELGRLESRQVQSHAEIDRWIEDFLALERSGWKGQEGTALGSDPAQREYFRRIARAAFDRGQLMMLGLYLDDRPIALKCNFVSPPGAYAFKIAFDESLARFSPGVQLELDNVLAAHQQPGLDWMDSCAVARHFMINRLWRERRTVERLWISTGGLFADLAVGAMPWVRALRRFGRRALGDPRRGPAPPLAETSHSRIEIAIAEP